MSILSLSMENGAFSNYLIFDIGTILIILVCVLVNAKRGFAKIFISILGYILAIVLGSIVSDAFAEPIYNSVLKSQTINNVQEVLGEHDVSTSISDRITQDTYGVKISDEKLKNIISSSDGMYNAINGTNGNELLSKDKIVNLIAESIEDEISEPLQSILPSSVVEYMMNSIKSNSDTLYSTASVLVQDDANPAEYIEQTFVRPILIYIIKMSVFFIVFFIVMIMVKMMSKSMENKDSTPTIVTSTNKLLGALLGFIGAIILLLIISIVLKFLVSVNGGVSEILNEDTIQNTKIFKYIYNIDTLKLLN